MFSGIFAYCGEYSYVFRQSTIFLWEQLGEGSWGIQVKVLSVSTALRHIAISTFLLFNGLRTTSKSPWSLLEVQNLGPTLDLLYPNLHFNKIPRWFIYIFKCEKAALLVSVPLNLDWTLESAGEFGNLSMPRLNLTLVILSQEWLCPPENI